MRRSLLILALASAVNVWAGESHTELFPLTDIRLTPSPFYDAQQTDLHYLMALDADKLLAPFRRDAGLPLPKESYGNWESTGLDGHMGGHYLSALALMYASTGDKEVEERLNYFVNELEKCQRKNGNGYIGGIPGGKDALAAIEKGDLHADNFSVNGKWVPWYNLHKTFAGLRDAYERAGNKKAKTLLLAYSDWAYKLTTHLTDEQMQSMLKAEHGGMNEIFVDVARISGDKKYLTLAKRFSHQAVLKPLEEGVDKLTGLHANTQIPKVIGFEKMGEALNDNDYKNAAHFFWKTVIENRTVAIGGNSVREHFHDAKDYSSMVESVEGPETCNTYNMLKLTELLYQSESNIAAQIRYADYYERALYNHILGSQRTETGGFVYFTPMRPNHYRVYSQVDKGMWCCVGSGLENHAKYGEFIYAHANNQLMVNLFIPSTLQWKEKKVSLTQRNLFPDESATEIEINQNTSVDLAVRYPNWVAENTLKVLINGESQAVTAKPGEYVILHRAWKKGDKVRVELPMALHLEKMPDQSNYYAVLFGPIVLAAKTNPFPNEQLNYVADDSRMGHIASGPTCPLEASPMFISDTDKFEKAFKPVAGKPLTFTAEGLIKGNNAANLELMPFFRIKDSRYTLYWPYATPAGYEKLKKDVATKEAVKSALAAQTIDQVAPGEQQPESDHFFKAEGGDAGLNGLRHWRHATGWMSYVLTDAKAQAKTLRIEYCRLDAGRQFNIYVNDILISDVILAGEGKPEFYTQDYALPAKVHNQTGKLVVKFVAKPNSIAGGLYDLRLLK